MSDDGLSATQQRAVERLLPLVLGLDPSDRDEAARIATAVQRLHDFLRALPRERDADQVRDLFLAIDVLSAFSYAGRQVHALDDDDLQEFFRTLFDGAPTTWPERILNGVLEVFRNITVHDVARALRDLMCLAYYSQPRANAHTGYQPLWLRKELLQADPSLEHATGFTIKPARERLDLQAIEERRRADSSALDRPFANDGRPKVAIIGSGPAGSVVAARLSELGWDSGARRCKYDIAVFEQGPRFGDLDFPYDPMAAMALMYERGLMAPTRDLDIRLLRARVVGGGSVVNIGLSVEIQQATFTDWFDNGIGLAPQQLREAFDAVKQRQRFRPFNPATFTSPTQLFAQGLGLAGEMQAFEVDSDVATYPEMHEPLPDIKGASCVACGMCNYGCRFGHHRTVDRTFLRDAEERGVRVHANARIRKLIGEWVETGAWGQDSTFHVRKLDVVCGDRDAKIPVDHVVLAAGAVGSPALLLHSHHVDGDVGWDELPGWDHVGEHFGMNYGTPVIARWAAPLARPGWNGLQVGYRAAQPATAHRFMLENGFVPPGVFAPLAPGIGLQHRGWMSDYARLAMAVNTIGSPSRGRVNRDGEVEYRVHEDEMQTIHESLAYAINAYLHAGAEAVGVSGHRGFEPDACVFDDSFKGKRDKIVARLRKLAPTAEQLSLSSGHPQGGMRMNVSPDRGVVGSDFRLHAANNLYCADASIFPTTITVNLQWTIMALARLAGDAIHTRLSRGRG